MAIKVDSKEKVEEDSVGMWLRKFERPKSTGSTCEKWMFFKALRSSKSDAKDRSLVGRLSNSLEWRLRRFVRGKRLNTGR
ncbi:hypothetical protein AMTR_s00089p00087290 [Amborella trichopoda]|uniref:Uncharacterized protein n=1 Tax=Amborella trichopoda TaxID=13333 RepID=W1P4G1_AMBTC|nr:hypothetical protein AMTR_s00089p00087290 [Amborella trichopoda]